MIYWIIHDFQMKIYLSLEKKLKQKTQIPSLHGKKNSHQKHFLLIESIYGSTQY